MSKDLHSLIHSLSQTERRYFRMMIRQQDRQAPLQYETLFDVLYGMPQYDKAEEVAGIEAAGIDLRPSLLRAQLKSRILDAMRNFHSRRDAESELLLGLQNLAFLTNKKLNGLLGKEIRRLRKLAIQHEHYHLLVPIDNYARRHHKDTAKKDIRSGMEQILEEMQNHLDLLTNQLQYTHLLDLMYVFARKDLQLKDDQRGREIADLMTHPLLESAQMARTMTGKMYFFQLHAIYHQLRGEIKEAGHRYAQVIGVWDAAPHFIRERPGVYRRTLGNYLSVSHLLDEYRDFPETIEKIRNTPVRGFADEVEVFDLGYTFEMLSWLGQNKLEEGENSIAEIESGLQKYGGHLRQGRMAYFRYNIALLYFLLEKHGETLKRFRLILEERHTGQREDLRRAVFLLRLVVLADSEQWDLLEYELRNTGRFFGQQEPTNPLARVILPYLRTRIQHLEASELVQLNEKLEEELGKLYRNPACARLPGMLELLCWAKARRKGISLRQSATEIQERHR